MTVFGYEQSPKSWAGDVRLGAIVDFPVKMEGEKHAVLADCRLPAIYRRTAFAKRAPIR